MIKATALLVLLVVPMVVATDYWWYVSTACENKNPIVDQSTVNPKHFFKTCNYISSSITLLTQRMFPKTDCGFDDVPGYVNMRADFALHACAHTSTHSIIILRITFFLTSICFLFLAAIAKVKTLQAANSSAWPPQVAGDSTTRTAS